VADAAEKVYSKSQKAMSSTSIMKKFLVPMKLLPGASGSSPKANA
jgi:hypothetical protein